MKPITLVFTVLLALVGFGAGLFIGRKSVNPPAVNESAANEVASPETQRLPPVNAQPRRTSVPTSANSTGPMSLAEMEAALLELPNLSRSKVWERIGELSKVVDPADIPHLVALWQQKKLKLEELISGRFQLAQINEAMAGVKKGTALRNVITF